MSGLAADTDVAVVGIDYRLDQLVVPRGNSVDVTALVANLGDVPINEIELRYIFYVNEVINELKWKVPEVQSIYGLEPGQEGVSTAYRWDTALVDPGRYHFVARASILDEDITDTVPCNNTFPAEAGCADVGQQAVRSVVVRVPDGNEISLIQPLLKENDPDPPDKEIRVPEGCVVDYVARTAYTDIYGIPVVNLGSQVLPDEELDPDSIVIRTRHTQTGDWVVREGVVEGPIFRLLPGEPGVLGARYEFDFQLDLGFLVEDLELAESRDFNAAVAHPLQIQLELFADEKEELAASGYNTSDYNWLELPLAADQTLDVYAPVVEWLYPSCGVSASDRPLDVLPGARFVEPFSTADPEAWRWRFYLPITSSGQPALSIVLDDTKEERWRVTGLPGEVVGMAVDGNAGWVYLSCADGSVVAVNDDETPNEAGGSPAARIAWQAANIGSDLTTPALYESGELKYLFVGASDGLHVLSATTGEQIEGGHLGSGLPISLPPVVVGDRVFFASGDLIGRVDPVTLGVGTVQVTEVTSPLVSVDLGDEGRFVFFGAGDGRIYALGEKESLINLSLEERYITVQEAGARRVTALDGIQDGGSAVIYAGTNGGRVYSVEFDGNDFSSSIASLHGDNDLTDEDRPTGSIEGLAVYAPGDDDAMIFVSSSEGELLGYTADLERRLACDLWGKEKTAPFLLQESGLGVPTVIQDRVSGADAELLLIRSSEGGGVLYGLGIEFIVTEN